jgi:hypothetical protein
MGSTAVADFGISILLSAPTYTLTQIQLAQVYVDTQGNRHGAGDSANCHQLSNRQWLVVLPSLTDKLKECFVRGPKVMEPICLSQNTDQFYIAKVMLNEFALY